jgi:hypothetical protein
MQETLLRVFFSHSSPDYIWIEPIVAQAKTMGIRGYVYEHDLQPGTHVAPKIKSAITRADVMVVFLSANGHDSPYVQQEIGYALSKEKLVIPFVERGVPDRSLGMLAGVEYIPFDMQRLEDAISLLLAYLARHLGQWLALDELGEDASTEGDRTKSETLPLTERRFTPLLLTATLSIDRETAFKLLGLVLLAALAGFGAYLLIQHASASGNATNPPVS